MKRYVIQMYTHKKRSDLYRRVTYVVEDVTTGDVNQYKYTLNFNPKMWLPEVARIE